MRGTPKDSCKEKTQTNPLHFDLITGSLYTKCLDMPFLFQCFHTFYRPMYIVKYVINLQAMLKQMFHLAKQSLAEVQD